MSIYEDWLDRLDDMRAEINSEISDLNEIYEAKRHNEDLAARIDWLDEAKDKIREAMDALNGAIGVS